jgi:hypothetical protein
MVDADDNTRRVELSAIPPQVIEQARSHPGGSVAEIDPALAPNPNGYVPPEAIVGAYLVGDDGVPTGVYQVNPRHGQPIHDDWTRLEATEQWLDWLPEPAGSIREGLERALTDQVPGSVLEWVHITADPITQVGGRPVDGSDEVIVTRTAVAVEFALSVLAPTGRREILAGSFTWAAAGLDVPEGRHDRTWFDIGMPVEQAGGLLEKRVFEVG